MKDDGMTDYRQAIDLMRAIGRKKMMIEIDELERLLDGQATARLQAQGRQSHQGTSPQVRFSEDSPEDPPTPPL